MLFSCKTNASAKMPKTAQVCSSAISYLSSVQTARRKKARNGLPSGVPEIGTAGKQTKSTKSYKIRSSSLQAPLPQGFQFRLVSRVALKAKKVSNSKIRPCRVRRVVEIRSLEVKKDVEI